MYCKTMKRIIPHQSNYVHYGRAHSFQRSSLRLISKVGLSSFILDFGGSDRRMNLPNYVNLDVVRHPSMTTVAGDGHFLPFRDNCFDIILCEAVIEHCKKPWIVVEELFRVLKKGGFIYVDAAFMQPLHRPPHHYFNMTVKGVESLFERFEKIDSGVQPYQMPSYTVVFVLSNYLRCLFPFLDKEGANVKIFETGTFMNYTKTSTLFFSKIYKIFQSFLSILDRRIPPQKAARMSSGVFFLGKKPKFRI